MHCAERPDSTTAPRWTVPLSISAITSSIVPMRVTTRERGCGRENWLSRAGRNWRGDVAVYSDHDLRASGWCAAGKRLRGLLVRLHHVDRERIDRPPASGELRLAAAVPLQQRLADLPLQRLDMGADRRLRDAKMRRRDVESAEIDDSLEHLKPARARIEIIEIDSHPALNIS